MTIRRTTILLLASAGLMSIPAAAMAAASCESLAMAALPNAKIDMAKSIPAGDLTLPGGRGGAGQVFKGLPAFCRVAATLTPTPDSDIKVEVWLPMNWNGKYQGVGNGGWAGTISYPALADGIKAGYATASTDTGHVGANGKFVPGHPEKMVDFEWRSVREMTLKAKMLVSDFYGNNPKLSYWNGCSTGGRQGLMEATRFPTDYDGIIAGDPPNPRALHDAWDLQVIATVHKNPASTIPQAKFALLHKAAIEACDALDGAKDGLIENPTACHFDPAALVCKGAENDTCLTPAQVESAKLVTSPGKLANGKPYYPGLEPGSEAGWVGLAGPEASDAQLDNFRYVVFHDPEWNWENFNIDAAMPMINKADAEESVMTSDLSAFFGHNGKLIMYHGWSDPQVSPQGTINYVTEMQAKLGGAAKAASSVRLFLEPGMGHCRGGDGPDSFDMVPHLDAWVTTGKAPERVVASKAAADGKVTRTRPLCAYPQQAHYKGAGSIDDEANFECKAP